MTRARMPLAVAIVAAPGIALMGLLVVTPLFAVILRSASEPNEGVQDAIADPSTLLIRSIAWSLSVAVLAAIVGWIPGRFLRRRARILPAIVLAAGLIPSYAIFFCWWRLLRPGNAIADYAITHDLLEPLREATLGLSLVAWSWPIAACVLSLRSSAIEAQTRVLLSLDGGSRRDRFAAAWRADRGALGVAVVAISLVLFGETTAFDAAQVSTLTAELRAFDASGATIRQVLIAAIPQLFVALIASAIAAVLVVRAIATTRSVSEGDLAGVIGSSQSRRRWIGAVAILIFVGVGTLLPILLLATDGHATGSGGSFVALHSRAASNAIVMALVAGLGGGCIALAGAAFIMVGARLVLAPLFALALLALAMPATIAALSMASMFRSTSFMRVLYDSFFIVSCAEAARFSAVAMGIGMWCGAGLARSEREDWIVHGRRVRDFVLMGRPILISAFLGGVLVTAGLAATETAVAARLEPPGIDWIAATLLNAIHYQDPSAVCVALPWMAGLAALCASLTLIVFCGIDRSRRVGVRLLPFMIATIFLVGCGSGTVDETSDDRTSQATVRLPTERVIGRPGRTQGRFQSPRALAVEPGNGAIFVIDKSARVQRFARDGAFELSWSMPQFKSGKPTGISISPDGLIYIADTHEHRVSIFDRDGQFKRAFGSYGRSPGEFVYPADIAFAKDGRIFVSEYGGNDRIQIFDADGRYSSQFGGAGVGDGAFARPQSMAFSKDGSELFVADACNHRIQVFTDRGTFKRSFGVAGRGRGEFAYPYGVDVLDDGSVVVAEFGNCRVQRIDPLSGECLGVWGGGGDSIGRLNAPWAVQHDGDRLYVVDSANGRIQSMRLDALLSDKLAEE